MSGKWRRILLFLSCVKRQGLTRRVSHAVPPHVHFWRSCDRNTPHDEKKMKEKNVQPMMTYVPPEKLDAPAASPDAQEHPASES